MKPSARMIVDPPLAAADNMARDEALLRSAATRGGQAAAGESPLTLRLYRWRPAAVSLGYFQSADDFDALPSPRPPQLVRRLTGGGAILHDDELTYSLTAPESWPPIRHQPNRLYELAHGAVRDALRSLGVAADFHAGPCHGNAQRGPFFCFARRHRYDLIAGGGGEKITGSAQRRAGGAVLQHGSIILRRVAPQPCVGANDLLADPVAPQQLIDALRPRLADVLEVDWRAGELTACESADAAALAAKYASADWTRQR